MPKFTPPPAWTICGPFHSPESPNPWQYALYLPDEHWVYASGKTSAEAAKEIADLRDYLMARDWA